MILFINIIDIFEFLSQKLLIEFVFFFFISKLSGKNDFSKYFFFKFIFKNNLKLFLFWMEKFFFISKL